MDFSQMSFLLCRQKDVYVGTYFLESIGNDQVADAAAHPSLQSATESLRAVILSAAGVVAQARFALKGLSGDIDSVRGRTVDLRKRVAVRHIPQILASG